MAIDLVVHRRGFLPDVALAGITLSQSACWSLFLGAKIYQAAMADYGQMYMKPYLKMLEYFAQELNNLSISSIASRERAGWLSAALEVSTRVPWG